VLNHTTSDAGSVTAFSSMAELDYSAIFSRASFSSLKSPQAQVEIYADMLKVTRVRLTKREHKARSYDVQRSIIDADGVIVADDGGAARRKPITSFSRKSRKRLIEQFARVRSAEYGAFITLTYPGLWHGDYGKSKRDLKNFKRRFERKYPAVAGFWRLEIKPRKSGVSKGELAPHYHLVAFGLDVSDEITALEVKTWILTAWNEIAGAGDLDHLKRGADVSEIRNRRHARHYVSKYAAKVDDISDGYIGNRCRTKVLCGRRWGTFGNLDVALAVVFTIPHKAAVELRRVIVRWMASKDNPYASKLSRYNEWVGFTAFGLGDLSNDAWRTLFDSTAFRMLAQI